MIVLTLTRHGQTTENLEGILQGQSPGHLNATGIAQAEALRDLLRAEDYDLMLCSDLERTRRTAEIINGKLHLPTIYTALLRERDWGEYTGRIVKSITEPPSQFPPSIENAEQLALRAEQFLKYLFDNFDGKRVLAVGHGYFNRCIQALVEQRTVHDTERWDNTELRIFHLNHCLPVAPLGGAGSININMAGAPRLLAHHGPTDYLVSEN